MLRWMINLFIILILATILGFLGATNLFEQYQGIVLVSIPLIMLLGIIFGGKVLSR